MDEAHKKSIKTGLEQAIDQKKDLQEQVKAFNQQILFCSTTVLAVIVTIGHETYKIGSIMSIIHLSTMVLLFMSIFCLTILLYVPVRVLTKAHVEFMAKLQEKIKNPSVDLTVIAKTTKIENLARKMVIPIFILSMFALLLFGIFDSINIEELMNPANK